MSGIAFAEAVAVQCGRDPRDVDSVLARNGVVADPAPPAARSLRLASISFHGIKRLEGRDVPFEFVWEGLGDGLWVIASADNLVGKSSVIQIVLWALRGTPKSLVPVIRKWSSLGCFATVAAFRHWTISKRGGASSTAAAAT